MSALQYLFHFSHKQKEINRQLRLRLLAERLVNCLEWVQVSGYAPITNNDVRELCRDYLRLTDHKKEE